METITTITYQQYTQQNVIPLLPLLNTWCAQHLRQYPYLYVPSNEQIINPSDVIYVNDPKALVITAKEDNAILAIASGIPLDSTWLLNYYFNPELLEKFKQQNWNPAEIWYMGYFLVDTKQRDNQKLIENMYAQFAMHAKKCHKTKISYIDVVQTRNDPQKPNHYRPIEPWQELGGFQTTNVVIEAAWPTLQIDQSVKTQTHQIEFFIKGI